MINKQILLDSLFHIRKYQNKDERDNLLNVEKNIHVNVRTFINNENYVNILFFHANAEIAQDYNDIAKIYSQYNINLILAEYRGYGLSNGEPNKENLLSDSIKIFDYTKKYLKKNKCFNKLIIMGRSLGSAAVANLAHARQNDLDACIIESGFVTETPLLNILNINPDDIDFKLSDGFNNLEKLKSYNKPILIIHSDLDDIIPLSQTDLMMMNIPSKNKDLFIVNGASHNNILMIAREHYFIKIKEFINTL